MHAISGTYHEHCKNIDIAAETSSGGGGGGAYTISYYSFGGVRTLPRILHVGP